MTDDAQPAEGQGGEGGDDSGLYSEYLQAVPEDQRSLVEPALKGFAQNANKKFQEHADYRKQWEPFEGLGVNKMDPEYLGELMQFAETHLSSEEALQAFIAEQAQQLGLGAEEYDETDQEDDPVQAELEELRQWRSQVEEREQTREQAQREQQANGFIDSELERLKTEVGELPNEKASDWVFSRAAALADDPETQGQAIETAYREYFDHIAQVEKGLLSRKGSQPAAPEQGGRPGTGTEPVTDFKQARAMAAERLRQST